VLLLGESFNVNKLVGFIGIWIGLAIFSYSLLTKRESTRLK
jgi:EamA domain-containing membrane protein RarD